MLADDGNQIGHPKVAAFQICGERLQGSDCQTLSKRSRCVQPYSTYGSAPCHVWYRVRSRPKLASGIRCLIGMEVVRNEFEYTGVLESTDSSRLPCAMRRAA